MAGWLLLAALLVLLAVPVRARILTAVTLRGGNAVLGLRWGPLWFRLRLRLHLLDETGFAVERLTRGGRIRTLPSAPKKRGDSPWKRALRVEKAEVLLRIGVYGEPAASVLLTGAAETLARPFLLQRLADAAQRSAPGAVTLRAEPEFLRDLLEVRAEGIVSAIPAQIIWESMIGKRRNTNGASD